MNRTKALSLILATAAVSIGIGGGCTPTVYRNWADSQVQDILQDRKKQTIGYQPDVEAKTTTPDQPTKAAYEKIPTTPIPPKTESPLEPSVVEVAFGTLGPELPAKSNGPIAATSVNPYDPSFLSGRSADRLRIGPPAPGAAGNRFDLFRSIEYAVQNSREYQNQMEELYLRTLDITLERWLFTPRPFVSQEFNFTGGNRDVAYRSALAAVTTAGVRQQLPYGGEVTAQTLARAVSAINGNVEDGQDATVALTASVPLLRGAGMVNLEGLISSERELVYQIRTFEEFRRRFVVEVASQYFSLISQQQQLQNQRTNFTGLIRLTRQTQALYQAGRTNFLEVQRSASSQLGAESDLNNATAQYELAVDKFKVVLGMPIEQDLDVVPVELQLGLVNPDPAAAVNLTTQYRLGLQTLRDRVEDARRRVSNAKNNLLPDVRLTGQYGLANRDEDPLLDFESRSQAYSAGIRIDLPIDRLRERNSYRAALIDLQRAQRTYELGRDNAVLDARDALRTLLSSETDVEINRLGIDMAQKQLDNANELLKSSVQGLAGNSRETIDAQKALLDAQNRYANARAGLQRSVLNYLQATGTLRLDPSSGALARAMDRAAVRRKDEGLIPPVVR